MKISQQDADTQSSTGRASLSRNRALFSFSHVSPCTLTTSAKSIVEIELETKTIYETALRHSLNMSMTHGFWRESDRKRRFHQDIELCTRIYVHTCVYLFIYEQARILPYLFLTIKWNDT